VKRHNSGKEPGLRVVAIGGGNGLSTLLAGLKGFVGPDGAISELSAIVTVTDDGGSSGRLRDELQMLPPGDIRNCMVALSEDSKTLSKLFRHRFRGDGDLGGHVFGNIFLAALSEITGDFAEAVKLSSEILASKGHIYPATTADVRLAAELTDGKIVRGETKIGHVGGMISRLFIEPAGVKALPQALAAIETADVISIGPGSLFTSLLPPLLVDGVSDAIASSSAQKVFVSNLMTQPGETDGLGLAEHLAIIGRYAPGIQFEYVVTNDAPITVEQQRKYAEEGSEQIGADVCEGTEIGGARVVCGNLLSEGEMVRHDPQKLAETVLRCAHERVTP
jgi:uncharacterized cofD-like protein